MIVCGILGLVFNQFAYNYFNSYTIQVLWQVAFYQKLSNTFLSISVFIAYGRFLHFLISWEKIGILVITFFDMTGEIVRFGMLFVFICLGFSCSFHMLYDSSETYSTIISSFITTTISIFSGYSLPPYSNIFTFPDVYLGYFLQVFCVVIGVVVLLNFLIAMMSTIYDNYQSTSTEEFRWRKTRSINNYIGPKQSWPAPLTYIQVLLIPIMLCLGMDEDQKTVGPSVNKDMRLKFYGNMVKSYLNEVHQNEKENEKIEDSQKKDLHDE